MKLLPALLLAATGAPVQADALRDPTRPPQPVLARAAAAREAGPTVTAVFAAGAVRHAIFNGRVVQADDRVGPYLIEAVLVDGVRYRAAGAVHELHLPRADDTFKKPAAGPARAVSGAQ